jgi:homoserine dehydrogenase
VVVAGADSVATAFRALVAERGNDIAGVTGLLLDVSEQLGPEPSVLVDTAGELAAVLAAVRGGHSAVTAQLSQLVTNPADFAVLRSDRRLGLGAALLPGLPVAETLTRLYETGDVVEQVELFGGSVPQLVDEAVAVAALVGVELRRDDVRGPPESGGETRSWQAVVGSGPPVVRPAVTRLDGDVRTITIRSRHSGGAGLTMTGPVGGDDRVAAALLADLLALARDGDTPWRAHRRLRVGAA